VWGWKPGGQARWLERVLAELNLELWIGDATEIRAKRVGKKKTDREDARHILRLLLEDRFSAFAFVTLAQTDGQEAQQELKSGENISTALATVTSTAISPLVGVCIMGVWQVLSDAASTA